MIKKLKTIYLLYFFILSLFLMETILRVSTTGGFISAGLIFSLIFSVPFAAVFFLICTLSNGKASIILSSVLMGLSAVIFTSQMVYYKVFKTFYSLYSAGNGDQVLQFWREVLEIIARNIIWVIIFFLPFIIITSFGKRIFQFAQIDKTCRIYLAFGIILAHTAGLLGLYICGRDLHSPYDLYYKNSYPCISVQKLGLLTTMRLDFMKLALGSPASVAASSSDFIVTIEDDVCTDNAGSFEAPVIEYNTMDIDFSGLISAEQDKALLDIHKYFQSVQPTTKNEYTGRYKGYNLILITAEGFSPYAVRRDVTPTLYKMVHQGHYFTDFYTPIWGVSTSDGEYVACTGLIPKSGVWSFKESGSIYMPLVMGNQLKKLGYKTMAYHNHTYTYYKRNISHPNMGYIYKGLGNGLNVKDSWPESDLEMMEKTIPEYINSQPFHAYYMTVSGHLQYSFNGNAMSAKNRAYVEDLPYSEQSKAYIACQIELDRAMKYLLEQLEAAGIAEKTLIALSADHYPYGLDNQSLNELAGHNVERNFELYKSTFILYTKGMKPETIDKPCSSLDILPTLSNLMGLPYDSRLLMGKDIFSDSKPLVILSNRSFITDRGRYNSETQEFFPTDDSQDNSGYIEDMIKMINGKFHYSSRILETDYYRKVLAK